MRISISGLYLSIRSSPMQGCQQFLFPFANAQTNLGITSCLCLLLKLQYHALYTIGHLGQKSPRNRFLFFQDCPVFPKIIQGSLSKHLAAVRGQVSELLLHRQTSTLSWAQFYEDAHAVWHVQGELARRFLFSEA